MFLQTEPGADPVVVEGVFNAPPNRVFRAWTDPDEVVLWFGRAPRSLLSAEIDLRVGGRWRFLVSEEARQTVELSGEYLAIEAPHRLVFSWSRVTHFADGHSRSEHASQVSVDFIVSGGGTRLVLRHEALAEHQPRFGVGRGWQASFTSLRDLFLSHR